MAGAILFPGSVDEPGCQVRFDGESDEFRAARWIRPAAFDLGWVPEMKREVYASVLRDFFSVELGGVKLQDEASAA